MPLVSIVDSKSVVVSFVVCWEQLPSASVFCLKLGRRDENSNKCCITATRHDRSSNDNLNVDDSLVVESVQCSLVLSGVVWCGLHS